MLARSSTIRLSQVSAAPPAASMRSGSMSTVRIAAKYLSEYQRNCCTSDELSVALPLASAAGDQAQFERSELPNHPSAASLVTCPQCDSRVAAT